MILLCALATIHCHQSRKRWVTWNWSKIGLQLRSYQSSRLMLLQEQKFGSDQWEVRIPGVTAHRTVNRSSQVNHH